MPISCRWPRGATALGDFRIHLQGAGGHASHNNVLTGSQYALSEDSLNAALTLMRMQTDPNERAHCCSCLGAALSLRYSVNVKSYCDATRAMTSGVSGASRAASARSRM
jgi:hypothetical protein